MLRKKGCVTIDHIFILCLYFLKPNIWRYFMKKQNPSYLKNLFPLIRSFYFIQHPSYRLKRRASLCFFSQIEKKFIDFFQIFENSCQESIDSLSIACSTLEKSDLRRMIKLAVKHERIKVILYAFQNLSFPLSQLIHEIKTQNKPSLFKFLPRLSSNKSSSTSSSEISYQFEDLPTLTPTLLENPKNGDSENHSQQKEIDQKTANEEPPFDSNQILSNESQTNGFHSSFEPNKQELSHSSTSTSQHLSIVESNSSQLDPKN